MNTALNRTSLAFLTNKSGGALAYGDVVVLDNTNANGFTTTTTAGLSTRGLGVIFDVAGIANDATGAVAIGGWCPQINLNAAATVGQFLKTHTVAGQATPHSSPQVEGDFGVALSASATPAALLFGSPNAPVATPAVTLITETVTAGSAASVAFTSIPGTYRDLLLRVRGRGDNASTFVNITLQMNSDGGANYNDEYEKAVGNAFSAAENIGATSIFGGLLPGASAPATYAGLIDLVVGDYAGTTFYKALSGTNGLGIGTGANSQISGTVHGLWRSTTAITRIDVALSAGNFVNGSVVSLYGML